MPRKPVCYLKMPKAASSSMHSALARLYRNCSTLRREPNKDNGASWNCFRYVNARAVVSDASSICRDRRVVVFEGTAAAQAVG